MFERVSIRAVADYWNSRPLQWLERHFGWHLCLTAKA